MRERYTTLDLQSHCSLSTLLVEMRRKKRKKPKIHACPLVTSCHSWSKNPWLNPKLHIHKGKFDQDTWQTWECYKGTFHIDNGLLERTMLCFTFIDSLSRSMDVPRWYVEFERAWMSSFLPTKRDRSVAIREKPLVVTWIVCDFFFLSEISSLRFMDMNLFEQWLP